MELSTAHPRVIPISFSQNFDVLSSLPTDHSVHILGDYNVDLLSKSHNDTAEFKNVIFSAGFTPLISTHTHQRGECRKTCIDNILTNNSESVLASGTIENDKNHKPIFQISGIKSKVEAN